MAIVEVPDGRLQKLAETAKTEKIVNASIKFVDIAGLVEGASNGEGLGNKFLAHIRECDAIAQVVRNFKNDDIIHVRGEINPKKDAEIINLELILADLETVNKRLENLKKQNKSGVSKEIANEIEFIEKLKLHLEKELPARTLEKTEDELNFAKGLHLLSQKPIFYVVNVNEEEITKEYQKIGLEINAEEIPISVKIEADISEMSENEAKEYMEVYGMTESGLDKIIRSGYKILGLETFFTAGVLEARAWTIKNGTRAQDSAGVIHTDFVNKFIKAEVVSYENFVNEGGWTKVKEKGMMHLEGKDYIVKDGDVCYFHIA
jgi:GTP-binding protein YchF